MDRLSCSRWESSRSPSFEMFLRALTADSCARVPRGRRSNSVFGPRHERACVPARGLPASALTTACCLRSIPCDTSTQDCLSLPLALSSTPQTDDPRRGQPAQTDQSCSSNFSLPLPFLPSLLPGPVAFHDDLGRHGASLEITRYVAHSGSMSLLGDFRVVENRTTSAPAHVESRVAGTPHAACVSSEPMTGLSRPAQIRPSIDRGRFPSAPSATRVAPLCHELLPFI